MLVSDHAERMLPTIRSRVQAVDFRRYPAAALEAAPATRWPRARRSAASTGPTELADRPGRGRSAGGSYLELARASAPTPASTLRPAAAAVLEASGQRARAESARVGARARRRGWSRSTTPRTSGRCASAYEERAKRESRRAEWDELRLAVDTIGLWYHDLLADGPGGGEAVVNSDMAGGLSWPRREAGRVMLPGAGHRWPTCAGRSSSTSIRDWASRRSSTASTRSGYRHRRGSCMATVVGVVFQPGGKVYSFDPPGSSCAGTSASSARRRAGASTAGWCRPAHELPDEELAGPLKRVVRRAGPADEEQVRAEPGRRQARDAALPRARRAATTSS